ncbi:putative TOX high mobility group box family member 3 [Hypsibius exemplaris]|uniref:TOX high mobility group box family member 3 n=1 Tax=Hypsibius exemplaris TaxID=2072580 RepID=A0A1W0WB59_HYPEX|nr:putative TOX high mobility group box family member 3 [Hypsibius exemplaris]
MLDWGDEMDSDGSGDFQQSAPIFSSVGMEIPSDNDVSCMVEEYLTKDVTTLVDEDWASVVDEAIYMITNPDHHMSMSGPMNSPSMDGMSSYHHHHHNHQHGMYHSSSSGCNCSASSHSSDNSHTNLSLSQLNHNHSHLQQQQTTTHHHHHQLQSQSQQQQQQQHQLQQLNSYDCYTQQQTQQPIYGQGLQYLDQQFNQTLTLGHDQYSLGSGPSAINFYDTSSTNNTSPSHHHHHQQQQQQHHVEQQFSQTSPVYYVAQTVGKIPAADNTQTSFNFEQFASVPNGGGAGSQGIRRAPSRTVSEEDYQEPVPKVTSNKKKEQPAKKPKAAAKQRRRKRDPNEPTKPVSAYALFFRDKQANIKGSKPDATFGEVSKIVAQMWDSLDAEKKSMYKKRTEEAKKDYLQQLAVYRASLIGSSPDCTTYVQPAFIARSSPMQMANYNRPVYSNINTTHPNGHILTNNGHPIKTHLQTFPSQQQQQNHLTTQRSPTHLPQEDCLQMTAIGSNEAQQIKIENNFGQVYRVVNEPDMKNGYLTSMGNIWDAQVVSDGTDGLVSHCREAYPSWIISQQPANNSSTKVVI